MATLKREEVLRSDAALWFNYAYVAAAEKEVGRGPLIFAGRVAPGVLNQLGSEHKSRKRADL